MDGNRMMILGPSSKYKYIVFSLFNFKIISPDKPCPCLKFTVTDMSMMFRLDSNLDKPVKFKQC